jgi:hypothetical protein
MFAVAVIFGLPMLVAGGMIDPKDLDIGSLIQYWAIMAVLLPFVGWPIFLAQLALPTAGRSRLAAIANVWLGGTTVAVCVINWLYALLSYSPSGSQIELSSRVVQYAPRTGIAVGLFCLCMLMSCGFWGVIAPLRPQAALSGALVSGVLLFGLLYCTGWLLFLA